MTKISVTASLNTKLKFFSDFENINPFCAITVDKEVEGTEEEVLQQASDLYDSIRKVVEAKIESDIKSAKGGKGLNG